MKSNFGMLLVPDGNVKPPPREAHDTITTPQTGYQLCQPDDPQRTHFWCERDKRWYSCNASIPASGHRCGLVYQKPIKVAPSVAPKSGEWVSGGTPDSSRDIWVWREDCLEDGVIVKPHVQLWPCVKSRPNPSPNRWRYVEPHELPAPPPEKTDAEKAWEKSGLNDGDLSEVIAERKKGFLAGYAAKERSS